MSLSYSIDKSVFKYASFLIHGVAANDEKVQENVRVYISNVKRVIVNAIRGLDCSSDFKSHLNAVISCFENSASTALYEQYNVLLNECTSELPISVLVLEFASILTLLPPSPQNVPQISTLQTLVEFHSAYKHFDAQQYRVSFLRHLRQLFQQSVPLHYGLCDLSDASYFLDFDGTISKKDTCDVGIRAGDLFTPDSMNRPQKYRDLFALYLNRYNREMPAILASPTLDAFLQRYNDFDVASLQPVVESGIFKNLRRVAVGLTGRLIDLRDGALPFLKAHKENAWIISQSWYNEMVCEAVRKSGIADANVITSSLVYNAEGVADGTLDPRCGGCLMKRKQMEHVMSTWTSHRISVCVGDSLGDLAMLLRADIPIVLHPGHSFIKVCEKFGIPLKPLIMNDGVSSEKVIFTVEDWSEIIAVLCWNHLETVETENSEVARRGCTADECRLMALTNDALNTIGGEVMEKAILEAVEGGATMVQIRDKTEDFERMVLHANQLKEKLRQRNVPLIINDRVDVAIVSDADGVHIGQSDMDAALCRQLLGPAKILGVSAQTAYQAQKAERDGADYLGCAVFPTKSKDDADVVGLKGLEQVCEAVNIPVVSIGGINKDNAASTIDQGAKGIAVISAIFGREDMQEAARELRSAVDKAL